MKVELLLDLGVLRSLWLCNSLAVVFNKSLNEDYFFL